MPRSGSCCTPEIAGAHGPGAPRRAIGAKRIHAVDDWIEGGQTNVDELRFACPQDHRMLDNTGWRTRVNTKNQAEWLPPPDLDWGHHPLVGDGQHRVNGYHHPERYLLPEDDEGP